jgi:hypothetical protein
MTEEDEIRTAVSDPTLEDHLYAIVEALSRNPADRKSYIAALLAIQSFLNRMMDGRISFERLQFLAIALSDLDHGVVADVLKRTGFGPGRRSVSSLEWTRRVPAALAVECLVRAGDRVDKAAERVAGLSKSDEAETVENWREELNGGRVRNTMAETLWDGGLRAITAVMAEAMAEYGGELTIEYQHMILRGIAEKYMILFANPDDASKAHLEPEKS